MFNIILRTQFTFSKMCLHVPSTILFPIVKLLFCSFWKTLWCSKPVRGGVESRLLGEAIALGKVS